MPILEVKNLYKNFGSTKVLKDISFSLERGKALAIIGSSGSGKTTLLRCLNFLETPNEGQIIVNDEPLFDAADHAAKSDAEIRRSRLHFATAGIHAAQAHRRERDGHGERFVEQFRLKAEVRHILQHALAQRHLRQVFHVAAQGVFGIRPAVNVVEQERGQNALRRGAIVTGC